MADRKGFNGLRASGLQVPIGSQLNQEERMRQAIAMEMQAIRRELFVQATAAMIAKASAGFENYRAVAAECQIAARSYFEGLGVIEVPPEQTPEDPAPAAE